MRRNRRWLRLTALVMVLGLVAAACGDDDTGTATGTGTGTAPDTVTVAASQEPIDLNWLSEGEAWAQYFMQQVWPPVFVYQPDGSAALNDDLMVSAEVTGEDPMVVTYEINPDAVWSDGEPIDAEDFIFMWEAQNGLAVSDETDPETGDPLPLYVVQTSDGYDQIESVEGSDEGKTVTATFSEPFADWQVLFDGILPRHYVEELGEGDLPTGWNDGFDTATLPDLSTFVSGGPYTVSSFTAGDSMTLAANEEYWGEAPGISEVVIPFITDATEHPDALDNDEIDVSFATAQIDVLQSLRGISDVEVEVGFGTNWEFLIFNYDATHTGVDEVRQAIALAADRARIVERLLGDFSEDAQVLNHRFFFPEDARYTSQGDDYDDAAVEDAKDELEAAGYTLGDDGVYVSPDGERLSIRIGWRGEDQRREDTADLLLADLAAAGIEVTLDEQPDFSEFLAGNFDVFLVGLTGASVLSDKHSSYLPGAGFNAGNYENSEVTELLNEAAATGDEERREEIYNEVDAILWDDMPLLPLFQTPEVLAYRSGVSGPAYNGYQGTPGWNLQGWSRS